MKGDAVYLQHILMALWDLTQTSLSISSGVIITSAAWKARRFRRRQYWSISSLSQAQNETPRSPAVVVIWDRIPFETMAIPSVGLGGGCEAQTLRLLAVSPERGGFSSQFHFGATRGKLGASKSL